MNRIAEAVLKLVQPVISEMNLTLWDVEFVKEAGVWRLRIFIDSQDGISLDDCERVSHAVDPILDENESIFPNDGYRFEVSSAGAERKLIRPSDFIRFIGHYAEIRLYRAKYGKRTHLGYLRGYEDDGTVALENEAGTLLFGKNEIALARLRIEQRTV